MCVHTCVYKKKAMKMIKQMDKNVNEKVTSELWQCKRMFL